MNSRCDHSRIARPAVRCTADAGAPNVRVATVRTARIAAAAARRVQAVIEALHLVQRHVHRFAHVLGNTVPFRGARRCERRAQRIL